jgi:hypothetical protein
MKIFEVLRHALLGVRNFEIALCFISPGINVNDILEEWALLQTKFSQLE